jgi:hypothetical protein
MARAIRWSDNDRYFGPLTYSYEPRSREFALMLGSGDGDDYPGCRLRIRVGRHTLIVALPPIIKPWTLQKRWVDSHENARFYTEQHEREYGFSTLDNVLHLCFGPQTHDSETTKSKCWSYPWTDHKCIRHSLYDLDGEHFATLPEWGFKHKHGWTVRNAIEAICPTNKFEFKDFDGEQITATCKIEEREWQRGRSIFRLLFIGRNLVRRSLDLQFSREVGKRKGSWKGGTVGHSIEMLAGETAEAAFRRYCVQEKLTFIGTAAEKDA